MHSGFSRRAFLQGASAAALSVCGGRSLIAAAASQAPADFDFVYFTDVHMQHELDAAGRTARCFAQIARQRYDFAISGGDLVNGLHRSTRSQAKVLLDLYKEVENRLGLPVRYTLGNHDLYALADRPAEVELEAPKKMYQDVFGPTYYSFDHKGYHFVVLDSIVVTPELRYQTKVDEVQVAWLKRDLEAVPKGTPVIVSTHAPIATGFFSYDRPRKDQGGGPTLTVGNAHELVALFDQHRVIAVLQGHTHLNEVVAYKGCQYITSSAVCGNWWRGQRWGHAEGYTVLSLRNGNISHRFETY